jgi:LEA14-like dessication related protein
MRSLICRAVVCAGLLVGACAWPLTRDPPHVTVAGIEPLDSQGLEVRMLVKLRVQNPNDAPIEYDGLYVQLDVQGRTVATGVSDAHGAVPRFGESVIDLPVTISLVNVARNALRMFKGGEVSERMHYSLEGKLNTSPFGSVRFHSQGDLQLPQ